MGSMVSRSGDLVYVTSAGDALVLFQRDATTGRLSFVEDQRRGVRGVENLAGPLSLVLSPDRAYAYVAAGSLVLFQHVNVACPSTPQTGCRTPTAPGTGLLTLKRGTS